LADIQIDITDPMRRRGAALARELLSLKVLRNNADYDREATRVFNEIANDPDHRALFGAALASMTHMASVMVIVAADRAEVSSDEQLRALHQVMNERDATF